MRLIHPRRQVAVGPINHCWTTHRIVSALPDVAGEHGWHSVLSLCSGDRHPLVSDNPAALLPTGVSARGDAQPLPAIEKAPQ